MNGVFGRSRTSEQPAEEVTPPRAGAKNRPTPRRRDQEAARKRPLVVTDRKQARATTRQQRREQMARTRTAMLTGDEAGMPARDRGPARRFIRDYVDSRWNLAEFMLPVMIVVLALSFYRNSAILLIVTLLTYTVLLLAATDTFLMWRRCRKRLTAKFGVEAATTRGNGMYAAMRAFQFRRSRMPRALVERGARPN
ncbi:MAG: DUF3043 domain-containing protein [Dermatophilaceae bacterium]